VHVTASNARLVRCPGCGGDSRYSAENPWRPFCSERCKNHDFGAWATESYRVPDKAREDDEETRPRLTPDD
jgi:endogenous inhibitor of DNA gyrase (YacG/DUF329 family)